MICWLKKLLGSFMKPFIIKKCESKRKYETTKSNSCDSSLFARTSFSGKTYHIWKKLKKFWEWMFSLKSDLLNSAMLTKKYKKNEFIMEYQGGFVVFDDILGSKQKTFDPYF